MRPLTSGTTLQKGKTDFRRTKQAMRWTILLLAALFFVVIVTVDWREAHPSQAPNAVPVTYEWNAYESSRDKPGVRQVCEDTCQSASNGVCEDGRDAGAAEVKVLCDLGSDCSDCGPWITEALPGEQLPKSNIDALRKQEFELFVRSTITEPPFLMAYTSFELDNDVSGQMHASRIVEGGLTSLWQEPLEKCCNVDPNNPGLVLDVGGNFGWYALYAATMGCRVITWEPIPHFREFLEYGVVGNNLTHLVEIRGKVVGLRSGETYDMMAPEKGNWGLASIEGHNLLEGERAELKTIKVEGERLDDVVAEEVCILKVDVEGFEADVFDSAKELFKNHLVHNVFLEYTPGGWELDRNIPELYRMSNFLSDFLDRGYNVRHVGDLFAKNPDRQTEKVILPLITKDNIEHDVRDWKEFGEENLSCSKLPAEMRIEYLEKAICQHVPFSSHPKGFRSQYFFNTNIWAVRKEHDEMPTDVVVGILRPEEDSTQFFSTSGYGIGGMVCEDLPADAKLFARCPCTNATVCTDEEKKFYTDWSELAFVDE